MNQVEIDEKYQLRSDFASGFQEPHRLVKSTKCPENRMLVSMVAGAMERSSWGRTQFEKVASQISQMRHVVHLGNVYCLSSVSSTKMKKNVIRYLLNIYEQPCDFSADSGALDPSYIPVLREDRLSCFSKWPHDRPGLCVDCVLTNGELKLEYRSESNDVPQEPANEVIDLTIVSVSCQGNMNSDSVESDFIDLTHF